MKKRIVFSILALSVTVACVLLLKNPTARWESAEKASGAEWRVWLGTYNPYDSVEVLIDAETGAVLNVESIIETRPLQSSDCTVEFRVCDGSRATEPSSNRTLLNAVDLIYGQRADGTYGCVTESKKECKEREYTTPWTTAYEAVNHVGSVHKEALAGTGGADCTIDILVGNDEFLPAGAVRNAAAGEKLGRRTFSVAGRQGGSVALAKADSGMVEGRRRGRRYA